MAKIIDFSEEKTERVLRARETREADEEALREHDERLDGIKLVLGDVDALVEAQRGLCQDGAWRNARSYLLGEMEIKLAVLRELLGVA